jgi:5-methyltetrahydrofolate--homocysteine methyltransferase
MSDFIAPKESGV